MYEDILKIPGIGKSVSWPLYYRLVGGLARYERIAEQLDFDRKVFDQDPDFQTTRVYATLLLAGRTVVHTAQLLELGVTSVSEWAAGFTDRGMEMTENNPTLVYCEVDREEVIVRAKEELVEKLAPHRFNLSVFKRDVRYWDEVKPTVRHVPRIGHHGLVTEGLLSYYGNGHGFYEITQNAHKLLSQFPLGTWVTKDVPTLAHAAYIKSQFPAVAEATQRIHATAGASMQAGVFADYEEADEAFKSVGFIPCRKPLTDYFHLMGGILTELGIDEAEAARYLQFVDIYTLRPLSQGG